MFIIVISYLYAKMAFVTSRSDITGFK